MFVNQKLAFKELDISTEVVAAAESNAREYGMMERVEYVKRDARKMPFEETI